MCFKFQTVPFCFLSCAPQKITHWQNMRWVIRPCGPFATFGWVLQRYSSIYLSHVEPWWDSWHNAINCLKKWYKKRLKLWGHQTQHTRILGFLEMCCGTTRDDPRVMIPQVAEWTTNHAEALESWKVWNIKSPQLGHLPKNNIKNKDPMLGIQAQNVTL